MLFLLPEIVLAIGPDDFVRIPAIMITAIAPS
jgi:hypothetical protein